MVTKRGHTQLAIPLAEAYRKSAQALNVIGATPTNEDPAAGRIEAKVGLSFASWGEKLVVEISGADNAAYISVTSSSALPTTLFDFGKNQRNVARFLDWLQR